MGWRARIGLVYPDDSDSDDDYYTMVPPDVTVHVSRNYAPWTEDTIESVTMQLQDGYIEEAAKLLAPIQCDSVGYACSSGSFVGGPGYDKKIIALLEDVTGSPATTGTTACSKALRALGVTRVAVATPYEKERNEILREVLAADGFEIVSFEAIRVPKEVRDFYESVGLGLANILSPEMAYRLGKKADCSEAQGVLIACTSFRTEPMIEPLERDLGKPVVTANQAVMWDSVRLAGVQARVNGLGSLYRLA
jgi:maleate isomerase